MRYARTSATVGRAVIVPPSVWSRAKASAEWRSGYGKMPPSKFHAPVSASLNCSTALHMKPFTSQKLQVRNARPEVKLPNRSHTGPRLRWGQVQLGQKSPPPRLKHRVQRQPCCTCFRRTDRRIEKIDSSFTGHSYSIRLRQWTRVCGRQTRGILLVEFNYDSNRCSLYHKRSAGLLRSLLPFDCKLPRSDSGRISSDALDRRLDLSSQQFLKSDFRLTHPCASKQADPTPLAGVCSSTASPPPPRPPAPRPSRGCPPAVTSLHRLGQ